MQETGASVYAAQQQQSSLITQYTHLVKRIAYHLKARLPDSVQVEDLIQAGMVGLLEASGSFDAGKGAEFETFAGIRIRGAMIDEVRRGDWTPRSVYRKSRDLTSALQRAQNRLARAPLDREVAEELGVSMEDYAALLKDTSAHRLVSFEEVFERTDLDEPLAEGDVASMFESDAFKEQLAEAISTLPEREQLILSLYYSEELNLKEIGAVISVSESRVSQLVSQAVARLRGALQAWLTDQEE